jgi:hypothetical protein
MRATLALCCLLLAACGDDTGLPDHSLPGDLSDTVPTAGLTNTPCTIDPDCAVLGNANSWVCSYRIADGCSATGHCSGVPKPACAMYSELCGCDGKVVRGGPCEYPNGYAGGPTTGKLFLECADGGT